LILHYPGQVTIFSELNPVGEGAFRLGIVAKRDFLLRTGWRDTLVSK
jgi:hypothetical protein